MADSNTFKQLLVRIGVGEDTKDELICVGLSDLDELEALDENGIKDMMYHIMKYPHPNRPENAKIYISAQQIKKLQSARYWITVARRMGVKPTAAAITNSELKLIQERQQELQALKDSVFDQDVAKPPKLKKMSEWLKFWEATQTYFQSLRGAAEIPLSYIF